MSDHLHETKTAEHIKQLKAEIAVLTLSPEAIHNYDTEEERTAYIQSRKEKLDSYGVDSDAYQKQIILENLLPSLALNNVVEIDFKNAS